MSNSTILNWVNEFGLFYALLIVFFIISGGTIFAIRRSWKFLVKFFSTVNIIIELPDQIAGIDRRFDSLEKAKLRQTEELGALKNEVTSLNATATAERALLKADLVIVKHEVQHNGGGSIKDAVRRIEASMNELKTSTAPISVISTVNT